MPRYTDIDWTGLDFDEAKFQQAMSLDREAWKKEVMLHEELFMKLFDKLPRELMCEKELLLSRLWRSPEKWEMHVESHNQ